MGARILHSLVLAALGFQTLAAGEITRDGLKVAFDPQSRTFSLADAKLGALFTAGIVRGETAGQPFASNAPAAKITSDPQKHEMAILHHGRVVARLRLLDGRSLAIETSAPLEGHATWECSAAMGKNPLPAILTDEREADKGVLITRLGPAPVTPARSLFDPQRDLALSAFSDGQARWGYADGWKLAARAPIGRSLLTLRLRRNYYRDELAIRYYTPIKKRKRWPTAPVVAMTWYGIQGWRGRPAQRKEWLFPNVDWVAEHLLPYAGPNLVFQLDDNYPFRDDATMRGFADYIRSRGLVPGIWFTPFVVAPASEHAKHPQWFLHDKNGKPIKTFGGINWGGNFTLNVNNPEAVEKWFAAWWHKTSETWGFDFFKIDGQPSVIGAYRRATDGAGLDGYRKGLAIGRKTVGEEKFINACYGIPLDAIGLVDGSRTGPDTGNRPHAINVILRWNFLNNVAWFCDPDAAANLYRAKLERARLNAQARVLTGQQFLTDDVWVKVPPAIRRVWQLSFPTLDIHPVNLYPITDWKRYDLFDLRIAKPWGTWDVVGLFNYDRTPVTKSLDLSRLPLEAERVHIFDFWNSAYLGSFPRAAKVQRSLAPYEGHLFALVPDVGSRPTLVSTSRHLSQGGLDLQSLVWRREGEGWRVEGTSSHLVKGDPYALVFVARSFAVAQASASQGRLEANRVGATAVVRIIPERSGEARWSVGFAPIKGPALACSPSLLHLERGKEAEVVVESLGTAPARFRIRASDPRLSVEPAQGRLPSAPAKTLVKVTAKADDLEPGQVWVGTLTIEAEGSPQRPQSVRVEVAAPPPENLALRAKARASSAWSSGYVAARANDGDASTRWNSRKGERDGAWLELLWQKPVAFNQVVIDECTDFGNRVLAWRLEAGGKELKPIARGRKLGRNHLVALPRPLEATRIRLVIERASETPTIWEIKVYRIGKAAK